ncbi:hypothetical protein T439DRAFT_376559 [Meredithblackwellia eburnea MCA 4105]
MSDSPAPTPSPGPGPGPGPSSSNNIMSPQASRAELPSLTNMNPTLRTTISDDSTIREDSTEDRTSTATTTPQEEREGQSSVFIPLSLAQSASGLSSTPTPPPQSTRTPPTRNRPTSSTPPPPPPSISHSHPPQAPKSRPLSHPNRPVSLTSNQSRPLSTTSTTSITTSIHSHSHPPQTHAHTLQSHLYRTGLLHHSLSDIRLLLFNKIYHLHRLVLVQSAFFESLLSGGFREEGKERGKGIDDPLKIEMERPHTRKAWEFILARLYAGGPELRAVGPVWEGGEVWEENGEREEEGEGDWQDAGPGFLISVLSCATYLEIPSIQTEAFDLILRTLTPWTIITYLSYALGHNLSDEIVRREGLDEACRGLEGVGVPWDRAEEGEEEGAVMKEDGYNGEETGSEESESDCEDTMFVGPEGIRVGEACTVWLTKWGSTVLALEESQCQFTTSSSYHSPIDVWTSLLPASWVRAIISADAFFLSDGGGEGERYEIAKRVVELRRRGKGLGAAVGVGSSAGASTADRRAGLKIGRAEDENVEEEGEEGIESGEKCAASDEDDEEEGDEDWRTSRGISPHPQNQEKRPSFQAPLDTPTETVEYTRLFTTGIHYSHLPFSQLMAIKCDISPTTGKTYVPQEVIDRAFFVQMEFRNLIPTTAPNLHISHTLYSNSAPNAAPGSPSAAPTSTTHTTRNSPYPTTPTSTTLTNSNSLLGPVSADCTHLNLTTLVNPHLDRGDGRMRRFFRVPLDDTTRINDGPLIPPSSSNNHPNSERSKASTTATATTNAENFFGFGMEEEVREGVRGVGVFGSELESDMSLGRTWVPFEPFRVCVEFWGVGVLSDKQRLYSSTFFYAGSAYNLYLQRLQKKGVQLGIYLHRQNHHEPFPSATRPTSPPEIPYIDRRKAIQVFFSLYCSNQLGNSLTKFSSGPDSFSISQSWGWRWNSIRSEEYLGTVDGSGKDGKYSSLRVSLVMGLI